MTPQGADFGFGFVLGIICAYDGYRSYGLIGAILGGIAGAVGGAFLAAMLRGLKEGKPPPKM